MNNSKLANFIVVHDADNNKPIGLNWKSIIMFEAKNGETGKYTEIYVDPVFIDVNSITVHETPEKLFPILPKCFVQLHHADNNDVIGVRDRYITLMHEVKNGKAEIMIDAESEMNDFIVNESVEKIVRMINTTSCEGAE